MTLLRANPGGWAIGDELTSGQANTMDINISHALDKTAAGDTLLGIVTINSTGQIAASVAGAVTATVATGITTTASGGISSQNASGGITLAGGPNDNITVFPTRTRIFAQHMLLVGAVPSSWGSNGIDITGLATTGTIIFPLQLHNGAVLNSVTVILTVAGPHSSLPNALPTLQVKRASYNNGSPISVVDLSTAASQGPSPANAAAWDNGSNVQSFSYLCNQNNVINNGNKYYVILTDENGANSVAGNRYVTIEPLFTNIASLAFP